MSLDIGTGYDTEHSGLHPDEITQISTDIWACFLGAGEDFLPAWEPRDTGVDGYVASVGITGEWNGHVILELTSVAGVRAGKAMIGLDEVSAEEVNDAVGELVNMVGGNLKGLVPAPSQMGLPIVFKGSGAPAPGRDIVSTVVCDFDWLGEPVRVTVWETTPHDSEG